MKKISEAYSKGVDALIKPLKLRYSSEALGPSHAIFRGKYVNRRDFSIKNADEFKLKGSIFIPEETKLYSPCVLYLHTRGGGRTEGRFLLKLMLPKVTVCLFDFAGSGKSEGDHITLGMKEKRDVDQVIEYIRNVYKVGSVILWGRSMGAVTSLLYAHQFGQKISGMVLDSPFSEFTTMVGDLVQSQRKIPRCIIGCLLCCMLKSAKKKTGCDLGKIQPIKIAKDINVPAFFLVSKKDFIARPDRIKGLFDKFGCENKQMFLIEGMHQTQRDQKVLEKGCAFIRKILDNEAFEEIRKESRPKSKSTTHSRRNGGTINQKENLEQENDHDLANSNMNLYLTPIVHEPKEANMYLL